MGGKEQDTTHQEQDHLREFPGDCGLPKVAPAGSKPL
jgi:hypothetical protein